MPSESISEGRQPIRFEKKRNMGRALYPGPTRPEHRAGRRALHAAP